MLVTYEDIRNDESIKCYITEADKALSFRIYRTFIPPRGESGDDGGDDFINFELPEADGRTGQDCRVYARYWQYREPD